MYDPDYSGPASGNWYGLTPEERERSIRDPRSLEHIKALYAGEISYADQEIGRVLSAMDGLHLTERTLIVLTSDHGESLTEHNYFFDHSVCLYDADLKVPLVFRFPDGKGAGQRVATLASLTDVLPTILDALGLRAPEGLDGQARLRPPGTSPSESTVPTVISAIFRGEIQGGKRLISVRSADRKYIRSSAWWADFRLMPASEELYDLALDPGETRNILASDPEQAARFRALAATRWDGWHAPKEPAARPLSEEDAERLRSLGYMQ
jgi:arylsulfatase A-like enzyme